MKTTFYLFAIYLSLQFNISAQVNSFQLDAFEPEAVLQKQDCDKLRPVYFNYTKRRLYSSNKMPLNGLHFLEVCRNINDPNIRLQIRRYDQLTSNKRKLVTATILCGVGGYITLMASALSASSGYATEGSYAGIGIGAVALLATPFLAISTGIPHQKRKEILFRDLPEAYNFHVLSQNNK